MVNGSIFRTSEKKDYLMVITLKTFLQAIDEINNYFEQEQYSPFYMRFVREFEETLGLENFKSLAS